MGLLGLLTLFSARNAEARSAGIASADFLGRTPPNCNSCHANHMTALAPLVSLDANDTTLAAGQQITLTLVVTRQTPAQTAAGFNLRASAPGTFAVGGSDSAMTRTIASDAEATHSAPKVVTGESSTFTVLWTPANGTTGTVTFTAWANSVNQSGNNQGDYAESDTLDVSVACAAVNWYADADGDGYGNAGALTVACSQPAGHVANNTDCNDTTAAIHPGATETCNGVDDNCTAGVDEGLAVMTYYRDVDGDTFGKASSGTKAACSLAAAGGGYVDNNSDCNDGSAAIKPGATESCNGIDDNCAGGIDEGVATTNFYKDNDGDSYGSAVSGAMAACGISQVGPGFVANNDDCDDTNAAIKPGATEVCGNNKDDNCNGNTDTEAQTTYYKDNDGDGFGAAGSGMMSACTAPAGYVASNTDCNDNAAAVKPGATEVCNGVDDNCAGGVDDGLAPLMCGSGSCVTMVAACAAGVPQTCTPVCPDAGADASDAGDAGDAGVDVAKDTMAETGGPDVTVDVPRPVEVGPDMTTPVDTAKPDTVVDMGGGTPTPDAGPVADAKPADASGDARDAKSDGGPIVDDGDCSCNIGGAHGDNFGGPALGVLMLLALVLRRRTRR